MASIRRVAAFVCQPGAMSTADLAASLSHALGGATVSDLRRLSGGASRETWRFDADARPMILQRQRGGDARDMGVEVAVLRAAHQGGVPVPEVITSSTDPTELGSSFMVLSHVEGETIARKILRDDTFVDARR